MLVNVFGIDPGTTTGWALAPNVELNGLPSGECDIQWLCGQLSGEEFQQAIDLYRMVMRAWSLYGPGLVVIEDFIPRQLNKERHFLSPVRVTAAVGQLLWLRNVRWALQQASLAKTTITDEHLRGVMAYQPGMPHANDAMRHCLLMLRRLNARGMGGRGRPGSDVYKELVKPIGLDTMSGGGASELLTELGL